MSVAFNKGGIPVEKSIADSIGASTIGTKDGSRIIYRVSDFRKYLERVLGKPTIDNVSPYDDAFRGRKGVIVFSVNWSGASGHIALWNGAMNREPAHDNYSIYVNAAVPSVRTSQGAFWEAS